MKPVHLLFLAPHWRVALIRAFREARSAHADTGKLVGADSDPLAPALNVCDRAHTLPPFSDPACIDELLAICRAESITAILPQTNKAVEFLDRHRQAFADASLLAYLESPETIATCHDKRQLTRFCAEHEIPTPQTRCDADAQFPLIAKPRRGEGGKNTFKIENGEDLEYCKRRHPEHLIQQFITGREFTIDWFSDRTGTPRCVVPRERLAVRGGEVMVSRIHLDPALVAAATTLASRLGLQGPCNLQGIQDQTGKFFFTDVNLRFGSGSVHTIQAGGRIPEMILRDLAGEDLRSVVTDVREGSVMTRYIDAFFPS